MIKKCLIILAVLYTMTAQGSERQRQWQNWAGNQSCTPAQISKPTSLEDLQATVLDAVVHKLKVRVVGAGHSRTAMVSTDGCMLDLRNLNQITNFDPETNQVTVQAGITMQELNEQLSASNLALPNQCAISEITLGGALATATHGSGHTGTLSSFVTQMELVTADGKVHTIDKSDPEKFGAARVSLGTLGVIYAATLQCRPQFRLRKSSEIMTIDQFVHDYVDIHGKNNYAHGIYEIATGQVEVDTRNDAVHCATANAHDSHTALSWFTIDPNNKDLATEIAVPMDKLPEALGKTKAFIDTAQQNGLSVTHAVVRFVDADTDALLSPANNRNVAYINVGTPVDDKYLPFLKEFETALIPLDGRPHWGKNNFLDYQTASDLYGKDLETFINVKNELDPAGTFSNDFIDRICTKPSSSALVQSKL